jgi:glycosyltransferase 2 family protein
VDERVSVLDSLRITYAGLFASNFLPTTIGGDVVRMAACLQLRFDAAVSAASLVVDRLVGMAGMGLVVPWGLARLAEVGLPAFSAPESALPPLAGLAWAGRLGAKAMEFVRRILANFQLWAKRPRALVLGLFFTLIHQICLYISIRLMLDGVGEPISWLRIGGIWSLVYFITLLPVSINGYGVQEISTTLLYAHLGGISTEAAAAVALLQRVVQMAASLPGAFFAPGIMAASRKARRESA